MEHSSIFTVYLMNHIFQTSVLIMECIELNWLRKYIKKIRSSQPAIPVLIEWNTSLSLWVSLRPGWFPGNAGNHGNDGKFHKSHQKLYQTKRFINKLCLGKISRYETVRIKCSVDSGFSNKPYDKKRKHRNAGNKHKAF